MIDSWLSSFSMPRLKRDRDNNELSWHLRFRFIGSILIPRIFHLLDRPFICLLTAPFLWEISLQGCCDLVINLHCQPSLKMVWKGLEDWFTNDSLSALICDIVPQKNNRRKRWMNSESWPTLKMSFDEQDSHCWANRWYPSSRLEVRID